MGNRIGVVCSDILKEKPQFEPLLTLNLLGVNSDLYHFRVAHAYKFVALDRHPGGDLTEPGQWAFVADVIQSGDLMVTLGREDFPFALREMHKDDGAKEFMFLGPATLKGRSPFHGGKTTAESLKSLF